jgi:CheY-like chemotaxis protein
MKGIVLVVDDDPLIQSFIALALEDEGYRVVQTSDGASLELAHVERPDVILLDILMPEMDGVEVSRRLRADLATRDIPIVAMSAHQSRYEFQDLQADDWLAKPFDLDRLYDVVEHWTRRRS